MSAGKHESQKSGGPKRARRAKAPRRAKGARGAKGARSTTATHGARGAREPEPSLAPKRVRGHRPRADALNRNPSNHPFQPESAREMEGPSPDRGTLELQVTTLAVGGAGVARHEGKVVFVPGAFPGEQVTAKLTHSKRRFDHASLISVNTPSPDRRRPPCALSGHCGGCPWMALSEPAQLQAKQNLVIEQLQHIGGIDAPPVRPVLASDITLGYRCRIRLRAQGEAIGFRRAESHEVVDVPTCLVVSTELAHLLAITRSFLSSRIPLRSPLEIEMAESLDGRLSLAVSGTGATQLEISILQELGELLLHGTPIATHFRPQLPFHQANHAQNKILQKEVVRSLGALEGQEVLDLYAGNGNLSIPLARAGASVSAVEIDTRAVALGRGRAQNQIWARDSSALRFVQGQVHDVVESLIEEPKQFFAVVLNPPRSGARKVVPRLGQLGPQTVVYVSCDPATLARDTRLLMTAGFSLESVQPIDMMPQTAHVETVSVFHRAT